MTYTIVTFPEDYRVIGFHGSAGSNMNKLGFMLGRTVYPEKGGEAKVETL